MDFTKAETEEGVSDITMTEIGCFVCGAGKEQIVYRLFRNGPESDVFRISVSSESESECGLLHGTLSGVSGVFEKIVRGEVRPYILSEILEDYAENDTVTLNHAR